VQNLELEVSTWSREVGKSILRVGVPTWERQKQKHFGPVNYFTLLGRGCEASTNAGSEIGATQKQGCWLPAAVAAGTSITSSFDGRVDLIQGLKWATLWMSAMVYLRVLSSKT
jgi:hypothetical protein